MNILEFYINKYKQFVLLIIGLPSTGKSLIAREFKIDLHLPIININNYINTNNHIDTVIDNITFKLYDHENNYNWNKLNEDVNKQKTNGVILYGNYIDIDKINFNIDFIFFIDMSIQKCKTILLKKKNILFDDSEINDKNKKINIYFKQILKPRYDNLKLKLIVNKYMNWTDIGEKNEIFTKIYDQLYDVLMNLLKKNNQ